jgi:hypothetical protein
MIKSKKEHNPKKNGEYKKRQMFFSGGERH